MRVELQAVNRGQPGVDGTHPTLAARTGVDARRRRNSATAAALAIDELDLRGAFSAACTQVAETLGADGLYRSDQDPRHEQAGVGDAGWGQASGANPSGARGTTKSRASRMAHERVRPDLCAAITGLPGQVTVLDETHVPTFLSQVPRCHIGRPSVLSPLVILGSSDSRGVAIEGRDVIKLPMPFDVDEFLGALRVAGGCPLVSMGNSGGGPTPMSFNVVRDIVADWPT
jgi:hypothetical protein